MARSVPGRLAVITGSNLVPTDLATDATPDVVAVDDVSVPYYDAPSMVLLHRHHHPSGHRPPHLIDHAANMAALAALGCDRVLALSSTGSLRRDWGVGTMVVPDDFFAPFESRSRFDDARGHVVPGFTAEWRASVVAAWRSAAETPLVDGATYAQMRGPRFETPSEVRWLAGCADVVGMTLAGECLAAGEAGLDYAALCVVDNLANGLAAATLTIESFHAGVMANRRRLIADLGPTLAALAEAVP